MKTALILIALTTTASAEELIMFTADWCVHCKKLKSDLDGDPKSRDYDLSVVDYDSQKDFATMHGVKTLPTLILVDGEKEVRRRVGHPSAESLRSWLRGQAVASR